MQKLNKNDLRYLINEEQRILEEQRKLEEGLLRSLENYATSFLGHAIVGDVLAAVKAIGPDALRLASSLNNLDSVMKKYTDGKIGFITLMRESIEGNPELEMALQGISMLPPDAKQEIKEAFSEYADDLKMIMISIVSIFPDVVLSGGTSLALSSIPAGDLMLSLAKIYGDFKADIDQAKASGELTGQLGSAALSAFEFVMKTLAGGPLGPIFGDSMTAFINTGLIARIVMEGEDASGMLKTIATNFDKESGGLLNRAGAYAKDKALGYAGEKLGIDPKMLQNFGASDAAALPMAAESRNNLSPVLTESRMLKLAGIK